MNTGSRSSYEGHSLFKQRLCGIPVVQNRQHSHTKVNPGPELRHEQDRDLFILAVCVLLLKRPFFFGINGPSITLSAMSANP